MSDDGNKIRSSMPDEAAIGTRLGLIREALGLSQKEIAGRIGVHHRTWEGNERGETLPSASTLMKVAALGFSPSWILANEGPMRIGQQAQSQMTAPALAAEPELLALIVDAIQRTYKEAGAGLSPLDLGRLSAEKYNDLLADGVEPDEWRGAVKVMAGQLRKEIAATATDAANRKREAS